MSLENPFAIFAAHDQPDVACLTTGGVEYRCYVWLNRASYRVDTACYRIQEDGSEVLVFALPVEDASADADTTNGYPLDCPRILASGSRFVVHWLQSDTTDGGGVRDWQLQRGTFNMASIDVASGWVHEGVATNLHEPFALYDAQPVIGDADDFVVAWCSDADEVTVARFTATNYLWSSTSWESVLTRELGGRILGVYAHGADNSVIITYEADNEGSTTSVFSTALDATTGVDEPEVETFSTLGTYLQVAHCRVAGGRVAVFAECLRAVDDDNVNSNHIHNLYWRVINQDDATTFGDQHRVNNLYMNSRPWSYDDGSSATSDAPNVYIVASYRSIYTTNEWDQSYIFALNMNYAQWANADTETELRPRAICNLVSTGVPDARSSGAHPETQDAWSPETYGAGPVKRVNHVSNVVPAQLRAGGPDVKSRVAAVGVWARMTTVSDYAEPPTHTEFQPENLGVTGFVVQMEDPWTISRDSTDPTQPTANFKGVSSRSSGQTCGAGRALFLAGGSPCLYDGKQVVEVNFPWRPEIYQVATGETPDGGLDGSLYQWYAVYTWRDATGQLHRSGPSRIVTLDSGGNVAQLTIRHVNISLKDAEHFYPQSEGIAIELYRTPGLSAVDPLTGEVTTVSGSDPTFYRVQGSTRIIAADLGGNVRTQDTFLNDPTLSAQVYYDACPDERLICQALGPYQYGPDPAGGLVGPFPQTSPAVTCCASWLNRVFAADALDPSIIWYTDEIFPDFGSDYAQAPFFSGSLTFRIGEVGEIVAMHAMNNVLVALTATDIWGLTAQDAGGGQLQINAELLHTGTGCIEPRSVVLGPKGVYFQSDKGYYLLNRGRELEYPGADVEDDLRTAGNVRSAVHLPDRHQIRLTLNGAFSTDAAPRVLIYDYLRGFWSRANMPTNSAGTPRLNEMVGGCAWRLGNGEYAHCALAQGALFVERASTDATPYADQNQGGSVSIPIDVQTAWINFAGVAGYQRLKEIGVQGEKPNASEYRVDLDYVIAGDYSNPSSETALFVTTTSPAYTRIRPSVQKCSAVRVRVYEQSSVAATENLRLVNLIFEVGLKKGPRRVSNGQVGT